MSWRVDTVPWWAWPAYAIYGYGLGWSFCALIVVLRALCRVRVVGADDLPQVPAYIFAFWHRHNMALFVSFFVRRFPQVCMNHPAWYMKPVHVVLRFQGMRKIVMGSTGHGGRSAAAEVAEEIKRGFSTFINPDGPAGPPGVLKKGVLHMALQSGAPVVPVRFELSRAWTLRRTWDRKAIPQPLSTITVRLGPALSVTERDLQACADELPRRLG